MVGEACDAVAGERELDVAAAVGLEGGRGEVGGGAVGLDDQALLGPKEVDLVARDSAVDDRVRQLWESRRARKRSSSWLRVTSGSWTASSCEAAVELAGRALRGDRFHVEQAEVLGAVADAAQLMHGQHAGEVGEGARDGRAREAVGVADDVDVSEGPAHVHTDRSRGCAAAQGGDLDPAGRDAHQVVQRRGGPVAQRRRVRATAGQDRGPTVAAEAQRRVARGVHPAVKRTQPAVAARVWRSRPSPRPPP